MKIFKIILCVIAGLLVVSGVAGVIVATTNSSSPNTPANPTDCKGDLHFLNDNGVCANCKGQAPTSIRLNTYKVETFFTDGDGYQLGCSFLPENTTLTKIFWKSSDENVATVDNDGYVTYVGTGTARIYATPVTGEELTNSCLFTLTRRNPDLSLVFEKDKYYVDTSYLESDLLRQDTVRIYDNGSVAMPEDRNFVWASSDENVVKVLEGGKSIRPILYVGEGTATITATGSNGAVATAHVYVGPRLKLSLSGSSARRVYAYIGSTFAISCEWLPEECVFDSVYKFTSSNNNVATVDNDGIVTIVGYGEVTFKAEVNSSSTAADTEFTVEFVSFDVTELRLFMNDKDGEFISSADYIGNLTMAANTPSSSIAEEYPHIIQLYAHITPSSAANKALIWTSSNATVATVDENGRVTAVGGGTATITATAHNGVSVSCTVSSTMFVENVTLTGYEVMDDYINATECKMFIGDSIQLGKKVFPENHNDSRVNNAVWRSTNSAVATVDDNGLVTAVGPGNVRIKFKSPYTLASDNGFAYVDIVVYEPIESIRLYADEVDFDYGAGQRILGDNHYAFPLEDSFKLTTRVTGSNAETVVNSNGLAVKDRLHYTSSNNEAVSVNSSGVIHAKGVGDSVITVTTDSGKTSSVTITVLFPAQEMSVKDLTMSVGDSVVLPLVLAPEKATPYLGISYNSQFVDITSDYEFDNGYLYLGQQITVTAKQAGVCTVTLDASGPVNADDPAEKTSVTFTITINASRQNLEACSWQDIANYSLSGQASQAFRVGDEKRVQLTNGEELTFVILDFDHDDVAENVAHSISFGLKGLMAETVSMEDLDLNAIYEMLPIDLQAVMKTTAKRVMAGNRSEQIVVSQQKLWLFAEVEIDGTSRTGYCDEGSQYAYWSRFLDGTDKNDRVLTINGIAKDYWLRSPSTVAADSYSYVGSNGYVYASGKQTNSYGVCFGFCV